jgi:hypothetical protein
MICFVCRGRGEVEVGVTNGVIAYGEILMGINHKGESVSVRAQYPTRMEKNPNAMVKIHTGSKTTDYYDIAYVETNPNVAGWGIAICGICHGTGRTRD